MRFYTRSPLSGDEQLYVNPPIKTKASHTQLIFLFCRFSPEDVQLGHRSGEAGGTGKVERHGEHCLYPRQGGLLPSRNRVRHCGVGPHH